MVRLSRRLSLLAALATLAGPVAAESAPWHKVGPHMLANGDMALGNPKARIQVIEYASASCSHCAHFNETVFPAFKAKYIDTGKVHYVLREFLTPPVQVAAASFLVARCSGTANYFTVLDGIFRSQSSWGSGRIRDVVAEVAREKGGLDEAKFSACLQDQAAIKALSDRIDRSVAEGIDSTPSFRVNGKLIESVASLADLDAAIAAARK